MVDNTIQSLRQRRTNMRCNELKAFLEKLGFTVRDGKRGGHKVYYHSQLTGFMGSSFNCGHGSNPEIKPSYIRNIIKILEKYKDELIELLEKSDE